jgi:hypothetical protein
VAALAPVLLKLVRPGLARSRTVLQGRENNAWVLDIAGTLTVDPVVQFLHLWPCIQATSTCADTSDSFRWKFSASGDYSTRDTYLACFEGHTALPAAKQVWLSFAPGRQKFFGWLAIQDRCWTSDRLARRGLPNNGVCPLCERHDEDINHLLLQCLYARSVWFRVLRPLDLHRLTPRATDTLAEWWPASASLVVSKSQRGFNSLCLLTMRALWLERNARIFDAKTSSIPSLIVCIKDEWLSWVKCRGKSFQGIRLR